MIVKDVDMNEDGEKTYVFGIDERFEYLKNSIHNMAQAIDNEAPDMMLWELRRVIAKLDEWDGQTPDIR